MVITSWHYLTLQLNTRISLSHPLGENYLPALLRRNSFGLSLLGLINPEPWTLNRSTQVKACLQWTVLKIPRCTAPSQRTMRLSAAFRRLVYCLVFLYLFFLLSPCSFSYSNWTFYFPFLNISRIFFLYCFNFVSACPQGQKKRHQNVDIKKEPISANGSRNHWMPTPFKENIMAKGS